MRFCAQELNKTARFKNGDAGKVIDFIGEADEFYIRQINVRTGVWPFNKDYALPPYLANFLKSDSEHLFFDLSHDELKSRYHQVLPKDTFRQDSFALEQPWGTPYTWNREGQVPGQLSTEGAITSHHAEYEDYTPKESIPLFSCAELCEAEILVDGDFFGEVGDIVFDPALMQARYLVVDNIKNSSRTSDILLPLEWISQWDLDDRQLRLSEFTKMDLYSSPAYDREEVINKDYEDQLCLHYKRSLSWRERPRLPRYNHSTASLHP